MKTEIRPGFYCDPCQNIAIRSPLGNWAVWCTSSDSPEERWEYHPDPRSIDRIYLESKPSEFEFIGDLEFPLK